MTRILTFAYGALSYTIFLGVFLYAAGFVGGFAVPLSLDSPGQDNWTQALLIDLALLGAFAVQHSGMARPAFKRWLTRFVPQPAERSTYVLMSNICMIVLFWQWRPLGGVVWDVADETGRMALYGGFAFGWGLVFVSTLVINHFDLFGLRQVWRNLMGKPQAPVRFVTPVLYRIVRHPLYLGWLFAFWCTPRMTAAHLVFAVMTTGYILVAIQLEERDLMREHPEYAEYRRRVPMLIPGAGRRVAPAQGNRAAV